jgi:GTP-binding protein EngB required for normal cell division
MSDITIPTSEMFHLLQQVDRNLTVVMGKVDSLVQSASDHETRIRTLESEVSLDTSLAEVTKDVGELTKQMHTLQKIVWGIPASMLVAFAAVAVAVLRGV